MHWRLLVHALDIQKILDWTHMHMSISLGGFEEGVECTYVLGLGGVGTWLAFRQVGSTVRRTDLL